MQRHGTLKDVATGQVESPLQIQRSQNLAVEDRAFEIGSVLIQQIKTAVGKGIAQLIPCLGGFSIGAPELVRSVLNEHRHQVLAGRRDRRIDDGRDGAFQDWLLGWPSILGVIEGALDGVLIGTNVNGAAMLRTWL